MCCAVEVFVKGEEEAAGVTVVVAELEFISAIRCTFENKMQLKKIQSDILFHVPVSRSVGVENKQQHFFNHKYLPISISLMVYIKNKDQMFHVQTEMTNDHLALISTYHDVEDLLSIYKFQTVYLPEHLSSCRD